MALERFPFFGGRDELLLLGKCQTGSAMTRERESILVRGLRISQSGSPGTFDNQTKKKTWTSSPFASISARVLALFCRKVLVSVWLPHCFGCTLAVSFNFHDRRLGTTLVALSPTPITRSDYDAT